jgi:DNA-binding transcriptional LysR family regulator
MPPLPRVAVLPQGHRLASKPVLRPRDFEGETFISLTAGSSSRHLIDAVFSRHDVARELRVETTLSEIMCGMVSSGLGVGICDPFTAAEFEPRGVVARPFLPRIDFEFAAVFPPQRKPSPMAEDFVAAFARRLEAMAGGPAARR